MIKIHKKKTEITAETLVNTIWVSSILAMILTLPSLGIFLGIYFTTSNLVAAAITGFGLHFVALAFSERISRFLMRILS